MSAEYDLSEAAQQSIDDIFNYTLDVWGEAQAKSYLGDLFAMFEAIAKGDAVGHLIQPEYGVMGRYIQVGKHFIYWHWDGDDLLIAEILHERMNRGDHLCASSHLPPQR